MNRVPETTRVIANKAEVKWCFGCRSHLAHDLILHTPDAPSYYGCHTTWSCSRCSQDKTRFPG